MRSPQVSIPQVQVREAEHLSPPWTYWTRCWPNPWVVPENPRISGFKRQCLLILFILNVETFNISTIQAKIKDKFLCTRVPWLSEKFSKCFSTSNPQYLASVAYKNEVQLNRYICKNEWGNEWEIPRERWYMYGAGTDRKTRIQNTSFHSFLKSP